MNKEIPSHCLLIVTFSLVVLLSSICPALSQPERTSLEEIHPCYKKEGMERSFYMRSYITGFRENKKLLTLSSEQLAGLDELINMSTATCLKIGEQIDSTERSLEAMISELDGTADKKIIIEKVKELYGLKAKMDLAHFQLLGKAESLLTDEQREKSRKIPRPPL